MYIIVISKNRRDINNSNKSKELYCAIKIHTKKYTAQKVGLAEVSIS